MKNASLWGAAVVVLAANLFALVHAQRNRAGTEAEITLTNRELGYWTSRSAGDDESGVALTLQWRESLDFPGFRAPSAPLDWANAAKLRDLGFDCSRDAASPDAQDFYSRQGTRAVFIALEYEGASWQTWRDAYLKEATRTKPMFSDSVEQSSHLVAMDVDLDAVKLRGRHPDRGRVLIVPAKMGVFAAQNGQEPARIQGSIRDAPHTIHVPLPFSEGFRKLRLQGGLPNPTYKVHLRYGAAFEPWVTAVEFSSAP